MAKKKKEPIQQRYVFSAREVNRYYGDLLILIDLLRDYSYLDEIRESFFHEEIDSEIWEKFANLYENDFWQLIHDLNKKEAKINRRIKRINKFYKEAGLEKIDLETVRPAVESKERRKSYRSTIRLARSAIKRKSTMMVEAIVTWEDLERTYNNETFLERGVEDDDNNK